MKLSFRKRKSNQITGSEVRYLHGFPEVERPAFIDKLKFPEDLTQLTAQNVSALHGKYTQLYAFANQELAKLEIKTLRIRQQEAIRRNEIFVERPSINSLDKYRRDAVYKSDDKMESLGQEMFRLECAKVATVSFKDSYDRYLQALSRELTRKTSDDRLYRGQIQR